ncbi:aspartate aminotransferase family protein [Nocardioides sp.]|uniref:aminotransferase family protein n=1 Tax=Nocardioides sp. TaxID=35761 RepID=UPI0026172DC7|nr:aspartate aminotransferase family protein [Nocardioides sp.]MCW2736856.1 aspartate aminotransferase family protein [Nocardioides sp.]
MTSLHEAPATGAARKQELVDLAISHVWRHGVPMEATRRDQGPIAVRAQGMQVWDIDENCYLDALAGGSAAATLGHGREDVAQAVADQIRNLQWVSLRTFVNEPAVTLAARLAEITPGDLRMCFFACDGSEAVESATQLVRSYHRQRGNPDKVKFLYRKTSYHGTTLVGASASSNAEFRTWFSPLAPGYVELEACYPYHRPEAMSEEEYGEACAQAIEDEVVRQGPDTVAGVLAEAIPAAFVLTPPANYLRRLREICDKYDLLWIDDEVFTGIGRTGAYFASEHYDVVPDVITVSKGITGGYVPLGAAIASARVADVLVGDGGAGQAKVSGHTYSAHPVSCAAGLAVLDAIENEGLIENVRREGEWLIEELRAWGESHPHVGDVRGKGFLIGIELVQDKSSRQPFDPALKIGSRVTAAGMRNKFMCRATGDVVTLFPALIADRSEVSAIRDAVITAVEEVLRDVV